VQDGFFTKDSGFWILCQKDSGLFWTLCEVFLEKDSGILDSLQKGFWTLLNSLQSILGKGVWDSGFFAERILDSSGFFAKYSQKRILGFRILHFAARLHIILQI